MLTTFRSVALVLAVGLLAQSRTAVAAPPEVEALIKRLTDKDETVRLKAAKELGKLKQKAKEAIIALEEAAKSDPDEDVRVVAKNALAAIKEAIEKIDLKKIDEKLGTLINDLRSKNVKVRLAAIAKLEELGSDAKPAGAALVEFGMMNTNPAVKTAANAAFERIDPLVHKEIVTVYYDENIGKRDSAVISLEAMGEEAMAAVPVIMLYHQFLLTTHSRTPRHTVSALVKIAPEDKRVQRIVLDLVGGGDETLPFVENESFINRRKVIINLMNELKIEDKQKILPLLAGIAKSGRAQDQAFMVAELGNLNVANKEKYAALMKALSKTRARAQVIDELGKLGSDAKAALPILESLKTDKEEAVRVAATAAINAIK